MKKRCRLVGCLMLVLMLWQGCAAAETRLMVANDLHYIDPVYVENEALLAAGAVRGDGKMPQYSADWLAALVEEALWLQPDALILAGDQSLSGEVFSHKAVAEALDQIQAAGIPVFTIPGNHDINNDNAFYYLANGYEAAHSVTVNTYDKYYARHGQEAAFSRDAQSKSYVAEVTDGLWLLMVDAGVYEPFAEAFGLVEESTLAWIEEVLRAAAECGAEVISATHQSLLPHSDTARGGFMVLNWEDLSDLLARYGVRLNLSGHIHVQHIARKETLVDVSTSALSAWPHQYGLVTIGDDGGIRYEARPMQEDFLPEGRKNDSEAFFRLVTYIKALDSLQQSAAADAAKESMAAFIAMANAQFYAGTLGSARAAALAEDVYGLLRQETGSTWAGRICRMLEGDMPDMVVVEIPVL